MFFEEYINFKNVCYLRHCGIIPVQSFRSHIRPQSPGLGLMFDAVNAKIASVTLFISFLQIFLWHSDQS
jgi:hypothetical protein